MRDFNIKTLARLNFVSDHKWQQYKLQFFKKYFCKYLSKLNGILFWKFSGLLWGKNCFSGEKKNLRPLKWFLWILKGENNLEKKIIKVQLFWEGNKMKENLENNEFHVKATPWQDKGKICVAFILLLINSWVWPFYLCPLTWYINKLRNFINGKLRN